LTLVIKKKNDLRLIRLLLDSGADVNAKSKDGMPVVGLAIESRSLDLVKLIVSSGADINATDGRGHSVLFLGMSNHPEITNYLIRSGADVTVKGGWGTTPLHKAVEYDHTETIKLLILAGADSTAENDFGDTPLNRARGQYGPHSDLVHFMMNGGPEKK
jgi:ankyrin repeat protein